MKRLVGHKSPYFQEEFPSLAASGTETDKKDSTDKKEADGAKEQQYGPGPSLRPQSEHLIFWPKINIYVKNVKII